MTSVAPTTPQFRAGAHALAEAASATGSGAGFQDFMAAFVASLAAKAKTAGGAGPSTSAQGSVGTTAVAGQAPGVAGSTTGALQGLLLERSFAAIAKQGAVGAAGVATGNGQAGAGTSNGKAGAGTSGGTAGTGTSSGATGAAAAQSGTVLANATEIAGALKKLGFSDADIAQFLTNVQQGHPGSVKTVKSGTHDAPHDVTPDATSGGAQATAPIASPQQTAPLAFVADPGTILSAAAQAISALAGPSSSGATIAASAATDQTIGTAATAQFTTGVPTRTPATANADSAVATSPQANTILSGQAATALAPGVNPIVQATDTANAAGNAAKAALAEQGVVSIAGQTTSAANSNATSQGPSGSPLAGQTVGPTSGDPKQPLADVAIATIRQASSNMPMTRMSEIRAKLQAVQLGTGKASGSSLASEAVATADSGQPQPTGVGTTNAGTIQQALQKAFAAAGIPTASAGTPLDQRAAQTADHTEADVSASGSGPANLTDPTQLDPSLGGISQGQAQSQQVQPTAVQSAAIPLSAVASTIVAHAKAGDSEFNIRLDPAGLGQIDVKMKVSSDGEVRAHMIVDQPATLDLMMRDRQQLQQSLDQAGFKTDPSSLQFSLRDQGQGQNQGQQQQQGSQNQSGPSASTASTDAALTPMQSAVYGRQSYIRADGVDVSV